MNATRLLALIAALGGVLLLVWLGLRAGDEDPGEALTGGQTQVEEPALAPAPSGALPAPAPPRAEAGEVAPTATRVAATGAASQRERAEREEEPAPDVPRWKGRVLSDRGLPLEDAAVTIGAEPPSGIMRMQPGFRTIIDVSATTRPDGSFSAPREKARDEPWVQVRAAGYRVFSGPLPVAPGSGDRDLGTVVLEPGAVLVGQVVDAGGLPVAEARVGREVEQGGMVAAITDAMAEQTGRDGSDEAVLTDAEGRFELPFEDPGPFVLIASHERYPEARVDGEARPGETCALLVRFPASASISGRLTGFPAGKEGVKLKARLVEPLEAGAQPGEELAELFASAGLGVAERSVAVEADGSFVLHGLHPDRRYELAASLSSGMMQRERCSERKEVEAGEQDVELAYDAGARLVLRLVAAGTGEVLRDADLRHAWIGDPRPRIGLGAATSGSKPQVGADGTLTIEELRPPIEPGRLRMIVRVPGFIEHELAEILLPAGEQVDLGTIALKPAGRVRVRVVDAGTGDPVARARVRLADARPDFLAAAMRAGRRGGDDEDDVDLEDFDLLRPPRSEKGATDSSGICELPGFFAEEAVLEVKASKYAPYHRTGLVLRSDGLQEELVQLHSGGTVLVRVVDAFDRPAPKERVQHGEPGGEGLDGTDSRKTGSDGVARFRNLPAGVHRFRLAPTGEDAFGAALGMLGEDDEEQHPWSRVTVGDDTEQVLVLALPKMGRLEGRVTTNGRPLVDAIVSLHASERDDTIAAIREFQAELLGGSASVGGSQRTDDGGRFELEGVEPGAYELRIAHPDRLLPERRELVLEVGFNELDIDLPSTLVEGRVADGAGRAIVGARVTVTRASGEDAELRRVRELLSSSSLGAGARKEHVTDALGRFVLDGLPAGVSLVVEATHAEFTPGRSEPFELAEGESKAGVEVVLEAAGSLLVSAPDVEGPLVFVTASFQPAEGEADQEARTAMLRAGRALMTGLKPGTWRVRLQTAGNADNEGELVRVRPGEQVELTLEL